MSPWVVAIAAELCVTALFCGVLFHLRTTLSARSVAFWVALWFARGAGALIALRYVSAREQFALFLYVPLEIGVALALVVIAVRLENQKEEFRHLTDELARLRTQSTYLLDVDPLTGLLNRSALARWMEEQKDFRGLVVVCDMDDFKPLNDLYGHLVGDEILHGVGKLVRTSIRDQDVAFRWGGDEFVIFFRNMDRQLADERMSALEQHLRHFHIRNHGAIEVRFSWGTAATAGRSLRDTLAEADGRMYQSKRNRRVEPQSTPPEPPAGRASVGG